MDGFIFLPVPTLAAQAMAQGWREGQLRKDKQPYQIVMSSFQAGRLKGVARAIGLGCLRKVRPENKLYVMTHGMVYSTASLAPTFLGEARDSGGQKKYTPEALASVLKAEGLTSGIREVNLFSCGTGVDTGAGSWATRFKAEMRMLGYSVVQVVGYHGDVRPSYARRHTPDHGYTEEEHKGIEIGDGLIYRASRYKTAF